MAKKIISISGGIKIKEIRNLLKEMNVCEVGDTLTLVTKNGIEIILKVEK